MEKPERAASFGRHTPLLPVRTNWRLGALHSTVSDMVNCSRARPDRGGVSVCPMSPLGPMNQPKILPDHCIGEAGQHPGGRLILFSRLLTAHLKRF